MRINYNIIVIDSGSGGDETLALAREARDRDRERERASLERRGQERELREQIGHMREREGCVPFHHCHCCCCCWWQWQCQNPSLSKRGERDKQEIGRG